MLKNEVFCRFEWERDHALVYHVAASVACLSQMHHGKRVSCCSPMFFFLFSCLHFIARTTL